jgi:hypothetical protein
MDEETLETQELPQHLHNLRLSINWIFADCWCEERKQYEFDNPHEFRARIARFRELILACDDGDLEDLAIYIVYNEVNFHTMGALCAGIYQVKTVLIKMRNALMVHDLDY